MKKMILLILDGFGYREEVSGNDGQVRFGKGQTSGGGSS